MAHYDMLVIGSGPAGQKAAIQAAKVGKKVGVIERKKVVGGICINIRHDPEQIAARSGHVSFRLPPAQPLRRQLPGQKRYHLRGSRPALRSCRQSRARSHSKPTDPQLRGFHRRHRIVSRSASAIDQAGLANRTNTPPTTSSSRSAPSRRVRRIFPSTTSRSSTATAC